MVLWYLKRKTSLGTTLRIVCTCVLCWTTKHFLCCQTGILPQHANTDVFSPSYGAEILTRKNIRNDKAAIKISAL